MPDKKMVRHVSGAAAVYVVVLMCCLLEYCFVRRLKSCEWLNEWLGVNFVQLILSLFILWLLLLIQFIIFAKKNNFKSWWIWFSVVLMFYPIRTIALFMMFFMAWLTNGFAP